MDYKKEWQGLKEYLHNQAYAHDQDPLIRYVCERHYDWMVEIEDRHCTRGAGYFEGYDAGVKAGYKLCREEGDLI